MNMLQTEAHEIRRKWKLIIRHKSTQNKRPGEVWPEETMEIRAVSMDQVVDYMSQYGGSILLRVIETTTAEELAAEQERVRPFLAVREAEQAELESRARTDAFMARARMYRRISVATAIGIGAALFVLVGLV